MEISLNSVMVDDQDKALAFYTEKLGFEKKVDIPMGEFRWLTLVSPGDPDGTQLALEPNAHPAARDFQKAIFDDGIPCTAFRSADLQSEYEDLKAKGVVFRGEPMDVGSAVIAMFEDTCGNLVQMYEEK